MKAVIDTNSLLSLSRYYLPFDNESILRDFIKSKIESKEFVLIDKVLEECKYISKGIVLKSLAFLGDNKFLKEHKLPYSTSDIIAPSPTKFLNSINKNFVNTTVYKNSKLSEAEFESRRSSFIESADLKQVILCLNLINDNEDVYLVTEESENSNDNKLFKKIPAICRFQDIPCGNLPSLLLKYPEINIKIQNI